MPEFRDLKTDSTTSLVWPKQPQTRRRTERSGTKAEKPNTNTKTVQHHSKKGKRRNPGWPWFSLVQLWFWHGTPLSSKVTQTRDSKLFFWVSFGSLLGHFGVDPHSWVALGRLKRVTLICSPFFCFSSTCSDLRSCCSQEYPDLFRFCSNFLVWLLLQSLAVKNSIFLVCRFWLMKNFLTSTMRKCFSGARGV